MKPSNRATLDVLVLSEGFATVVAELASLARLKASQASEKDYRETWDEVAALLVLASMGSKVSKV